MSLIMYSMPGKIAFVKKAKIFVLPTDIEVRLDDNVINHDNGQFDIVDEPNAGHTLTFNTTIEKLYVEDLDVTHLVKENALTFYMPIYRWLIDHLDNK